MIRTGPVESEADLEAILALQRENLATNLTAAEIAREGFVTVVHSLETLRRMHALAPSIVARGGDRLAGYALVMPAESRVLLPILEPMFRLFEGLSWRGRPLRDRRWYVMGQVCVAKEFRGTGVFDALYAEHRARHSAGHDLLLTEIATRNTRSMRAHARVGFEVVTTYRDETDEWAVVAWGW